MSIATGTRLGQYEVQDFIGQGAMGLVYRAYHPELERTGAVKILQAISPDADTVARFRHEAQAIAQLRHPNIVNVYDFGAFQGTPYMIVEYIPGGSLAARMNQGKLDPGTAVRFLRGIAAGMDYAHKHGVVHRDIKPANVLLTADDTPVLADFGLAKLLQGSSLKSMTGVTTGTPAYMAPEQVAGHQVGPAADRYSLATIAYEMLTGVIPFDGEALMELLYAQVHREPPPPSSRLPTLSVAVDDVILRGLAKDPAARWESATAFVDALETALEGAAPRAVEQTMVMSPLASTVPLAGTAVAERVAAIPETSTLITAYPSPPPYPPNRVRRRARIALIAAGLVLALALGSIGAWLALRPPVTLSLSPDTVAAGGTVIVSASHVPANESGEVQLWSVLRRVSFRADQNGDVSVALSIPADIDTGQHHVRICWRGACHADQVLLVVSNVALTAATPSASPTVGTPGSTPRAGATPTGGSGSTPRPTSNPTSSPTRPPASPTPTKPPSPSVTVNSVTLTTSSVTFHYFYGGSTTLFVCQNGTCHSAGTKPVSGGANVVVSFATPAGILVTAPPLVGQAYVYTTCCGGTLPVNVAA